VELRYEPERVTVTVTDDGRPRTAADADDGDGSTSGGHGQLHMRERVAVAGGRLEVGPLRGGGYRVRASFPVPVTTAPVVTA
jgi:signal transduction histidine kinase